MKTGPIVFVAAGSGGHIQSALAVLEYMQESKSPLFSKCIFVGSNLAMEGEVKKVSLEEQLCARMNIPFYKVRGGKLQRQFSLRSIKLFLGVILSFWDSFFFFLKHKPAVIVAFGGYSSLPMGFISKLFGAKLIIHEQTTSIGLTNRLLRRFADINAISYKQSIPFFTHSKRVELTGSPSRLYLFSINTFADLKSYLSTHPTPLTNEQNYLSRLEYFENESKTKPMIMILGGSQGSHLINEYTAELMADLAKDNLIFLQTGDNQVMKDFDSITEKLAKLPAEIQKNILVRKFVFEEMGFLYKHAKVFICRSGANSVYEAGMMSLPSIFVPIPWLTKNEQYTNAKILADVGQAIILDQNTMTKEELKDAIEKQLHHKQTISKEELAAMFPADAGARITKLVEEMIQA